ncbi:MAG: dihydrofolate reductase family protein [Puia sp.]
MRKLVVSVWMSVDGIFDADSMDEWYTPFDSISRQNYIREGIMACDALMFGRSTYEMLAPHWSAMKNNEMGVAAKLNSTPKYVISSSLKKADWNNSTIISKDVNREITKLKQLAGREIQIEGSATLIKSLAGTGLIDEYRLLIHPIIMGKGKQFFKEGMHTDRMKLINTTTLDKGVMVLCYQQ